MILSVFIILFLILITPVTVLAQQLKASFGCSPASGTYKVGETFTVDYNLNTRSNQVLGADLYATFDTTILEPVGTQSTLVTNKTGWTTATANSVDTSLGKIHLDYGSNQATFSGSGPIGQIAFKAKSAGQAQFNFTFFQPNDNTTPAVAKVWGKPDGTNLSNILTDVTNCIYAVESAVATPTATLVPASPTPTRTAIGGPTVVPTVSNLPRSGSAQITYSFLILAVLLVGAGVTASQRIGGKSIN